MRNLSKSAAFSRARFEDQEGLVAERKAQHAEFSAALENVLIDIADANVRAPYDAVVLEKHVEVGGYVKIGGPVVTLLNEKALQVEVDVAASRMSEIKPGTAAVIVSDDGKRYPTSVKTIIPDDNTRSRTRPVRLEANFGSDAAKFAHNQSVSVELPLSSADQILTVHKDAVVNRANGNVVFIVKGTNAVMRNLKIGRGIGNKFEVMDGLKAGEKVVIRGNERLGAGVAVRIVK
jgi:RND family efflux transporter MFP subunit